jgi:hypothetical protein
MPPLLSRYTALRQTIACSFSTTSVCLRGKISLPKRRDPPRTTPSVSSGNADADIQTFMATLNRRLENLLYADNARPRTRKLAFSDQQFESLVLQFRDDVMTNLKERMKDGNLENSPSRIPAPQQLYNEYKTRGFRGMDDVILRYFQQYNGLHSPSLRDNEHELKLTAVDMRNPGEWFPAARNIRRKIIMHVGPTNSGKTYQALKRLESARRGWYGGPLRLLAHEVFNRMNSKGIKCNLRTGEEIRIVDPNAPLMSSTIEMFTDNVEYDVAVIDEIQMIGNPDRGFAWTTALLGLCAKEVHLCGEEATVPLIRRIADSLGEEVEVNRYERLSPLNTETRPLRLFKYIQKGDCVVSFSRRSIFYLKDRIEQYANLKCALVYGGLPPETRSMQADLFNDPNSGVDVIVASDAIGMGLNLYFLVCYLLIASQEY